MLVLISSRGRVVARLTAVTLATAVLCGLAAAASASPAPAGPVLGGITSQGLPVVVIPAASGRRLARLRIALRVKCDSGGTTVVPDRADGLGVAPDGTVAGLAVIGPHPPLVRALDVVRGRYDRAAQTYTGTWRMTMVFFQAGRSDRCDTGVVRVHARL